MERSCNGTLILLIINNDKRQKIYDQVGGTVLSLVNHREGGARY